MPRPLSVMRQAAIGLQRHLDAAGMAGDGFVHGIVEHFGGEMMQRALVGAADVHARPAAHRLQPFEHLDMAGVIVGRAGGGGEKVAHGAVIGTMRADEQRASALVHTLQIFLRWGILSLAFFRAAVHKDEANMAILPKDFTSRAGAKAPALFLGF